MSEKLENLKLILKNDRRVWAIGVFLLFCSVLVLLSSGPKKGPRRSSMAGPVQQNPADSNGRIREKGNVGLNDLVVTMASDVKAIKEEARKNRESVIRLQKERESDQERVATIFQGVLDKLDKVSEDFEVLKENQGKQDDAGYDGVPGESGDLVLPTEEKIATIGFDTNDLPPVPPKKPKAPVKVSHITLGDNVSLQLLTGVAAPVDGTPYPVMFKVTGPITGPDGSSLDIGEARVIAAAEGKDSNSRVVFRLSELAIRHKDGRRSVIPVDGWIIGEDGVRGMKGELKDNLGATMVALSTIASAQYLGDRVADKADNDRGSQTGAFSLLGSGGSAVSVDDLDNAIALGVTDTFENMTDIIVKRFESQVPVVEILPGRTVQAVFSSNAEVEILSDDDDNGDYDSSLS